MYGKMPAVVQMIQKKWRRQRRLNRLNHASYSGGPSVVNIRTKFDDSAASKSGKKSLAEPVFHDSTISVQGKVGKVEFNLSNHSKEVEGK